MPGFKLGELILSSKPYAYVLSNNVRGQFCDYCFKRNEDLKRCSQCSFLYFCDKSCQAKAWNLHKLECKFIKKAGKKQPTPSLRLIAQIILKIKKYGEEEIYEEIQGRKISFSTLMSHADNIKKDLKRCQIMMAMLITLKEYIGPENIPPPPVFTEIFGKMSVNSFSISHEMAPIGSGLYLGASIFDHSCDPDATVIFDGAIINVRMVKDVPHRDVQKVFVSYIGELYLKEEKQKMLQERYYFNCNCESCLSSKNDELMTKLLKNDTDSKELALQCQQEFREIQQMFENQKDPKLIDEAVVKLLKVQNEILAETNIYKVKALEIAFECCIQLKRYKDALIIAPLLDGPFRLYLGNYHPALGFLLFKIGKILHFLELSRPAVPKLTEAENIFIITHGQEHPLTKELQSLLQEARLASCSLATNPH